MIRYNDNIRQCPKCQEEFYPGDCDIVATYPTEKLLEEGPKNALKREWARMHPKPLLGYNYTKQLATRRCPHCQYLLPNNIDRVRTVNVAVVGNYNSGKSHFIASLIQQLRQGLIERPTKYARFASVTPRVEERYINNYITPLYDKQQKLDNTLPLTAGEIIEPLIYELTVRTSKELLHKSINLVIHDASGEDYSTPEKIVGFTPHVLNAKGLIYLADPLDMPKIAGAMPSHITSPSGGISLSVGKSSSAMLSKIDQQIERRRRLSPGRGLSSLPVAVTLSKSDLLKYLRPVNQTYSIFTNPVYGGEIDFADLDTVNTEVRDILTKFGDHSLLQAVGESTQARFFAVSATGYSPDAAGLYAKVEPIRCLDPFLWILHKLDLLPGEGDV